MDKLIDHPSRFSTRNELHARPFPVQDSPGRAICLALKPAEETPEDEPLKALIRLLDRYGAVHPVPDAKHYSGEIGQHRLKWERHTEFVTYTVFFDGAGARPFDPADFEVFPDDWVAGLYATRITSMQIHIAPYDLSGDETPPELDEWFQSESLAVSTVLDQSALIASDFRLNGIGNARFAVFTNPDTGAQRVGRILQRICEIEIYTSMAMLGLSKVRHLAPRMAELEERLTALVAELPLKENDPERSLDKLLVISAELEAMQAAAAFRFSGTRAYEAIVNQRVEVLREARIGGRQTFTEFMMRRFDPAMRTVESTSKRLAKMTARAGRAGQLLSTQVDVARSKQNQKLLESMDRRADLALRLQQTVEGLSVVAISYYAVSLATYLLYPLAEALEISKGMLTAAVTLPVIGLVWWLVRRIKHSMH
ncbi:DUF3422 family protein [Actibacterium pelagium]|uniref:Membrane-anchored protein n=1 Tax=Actibacterium pelagium TaxID=2029103 RepID=A0A917EJ12_9RHOB|nr:DUF3422 domain-containing protein [Actibacterium pelagium]GGE47087.1 hypothetical protein GCM10011517_13570 [Actibacterium pelagium]